MIYALARMEVKLKSGKEEAIIVYSPTEVNEKCHRVTTVKEIKYLLSENKVQIDNIGCNIEEDINKLRKLSNNKIYVLYVDDKVAISSIKKGTEIDLVYKETRPQRYNVLCEMVHGLKGVIYDDVEIDSVSKAEARVVGSERSGLQFTPNVYKEETSNSDKEEVGNGAEEVFVNTEEEEKEVETIGLKDCQMCNGAGYYETTFGIRAICPCIAEKRRKEEERIRREKEASKKAKYNVTGAERQMAVAKRLIPEHRQNDEFDIDFIMNRISAICTLQSCKVEKFSSYRTVLSNILVSISTGTKLDKSYLIGAPNGFGKQTFANTCIKRLSAFERKVVPYASVLEVSELKKEHENEVLKAFKKKAIPTYSEQEDKSVSCDEIENKIELEDIKYTWKDYTQADVIFIYLTTIDSAKVEANTLKSLLQIRGNNGLPTIVFMESSLAAYTSDVVMKKAIWDDIVSPNQEMASYDRMYYTSTYKRYNFEEQVGNR